MQERETIHTAIEMLDRYYLHMSQVLDLKSFRKKFMHPRLAIEHQVTCLLISSKLIEIDDNIILLIHLRQYVARQLERKKERDMSLMPSIEAVFECERRICEHFQWNFNFVLPIHFLRMLLAQGVVYTNELKPYEENLPEEDYQILVQELTRAISAEALSLCDILTTKGQSNLRERQPSEIAASIIYFARKNILEADDISKLIKVPCIWPE